MYTITLKEALERLDEITILRDSQYEEIKELIELVYKSGRHDGWYDAMDVMTVKA